MKFWMRACLVLLMLLPVLCSAVIITEIKVTSRRIKIQNTDFVLAYTSVRQGEQMDRLKISRDVKNLMASGRFAFIDTELIRTDAGYVLNYIVELKPRLGKPITVSGASEFSENKIRDLMKLEVGNAIDDAVLTIHTQRVIAEYNKKYFPDTTISWITSVNPDTGFATVHLNVEEGPKASMRKIEFTGNTYVRPTFRERFVAGLFRRKPVSDKSVPPKMLRDSMRQRRWNMFSFLTRSGIYDPEYVEYDRGVIRALYQNNGYLDTQVGRPEVIEYKPHKLKATFPIKEGDRYRIGAITLRGILIFPESNLWALVKIKTGDVASMSTIQKTAMSLRNYYLSRGYMRARARPAFAPHLKEPVVDIQFEITEGRLTHVRYIEIQNNIRTKDEVIRRELLIFPGEVYDQMRINRSERILQNLGFFKRDGGVISYPRETMDPAMDDLVFEVEETRTGQFMVGAGYSSVDALIGFIEVSQGNFDLFGWPHFTGDGQKLRLRAQFGSRAEDYRLSFVEPWFLNRKLSLGIDLYDTMRNNLSPYYSEQRIGGAVTIGKPIDLFFQRANITYSLDRFTIFDVTDDAIELIKNEAGSRNTSTLRLALVRDTRNNMFVPTSGSRLEIAGRISGGILGFDTDVYGFELDASTYFPLWFDHVLSFRGWAQNVQEYSNTDQVPLFDRLFLGGPQDLRGFKYRYVSPYDEGEPIGGKSAALATIEYTIPIVKTFLRFAVFYDIGNVWLDAYEFDLLDYCSDIGIGARIDIMGFPLRIDYAWPLKISGDIERTSAQFNFSLGFGF